MDINLLNKYLDEGKLKKGVHPFYNLFIWNYSETVQYNKEWDDITRQCRGLITDDSGNIVAKSFPKFFNLEENLHNPTEKYRVFNKVDGSLGILFYYKEEWIMTSRGSFNSEQSTRAFEILNSKFPQFVHLDKELSYLFEIIYPSNKIIVDYKDTITLVYLSSFDKSGNEYLLLNEMKTRGFDTVEEYNYNMSLAELKNLNETNKEGFVILFENGERIKIKFENYLLITRCKSNLTVKNIYEYCKSGVDPLEQIPDEFMPWYKDIVSKIKNEYEIIHSDCLVKYKTYYSDQKREFANAVKDEKYKKVLFTMYDNKPFVNIIYGFINYTAFEEKKQHALSFDKPVFYILIGCSGSGKSTWVNQFVNNHKNSVVINRDNMRRMLFSFKTEQDIQNYYKSANLKDKEKLVTKSLNSTVEIAIDNNKIIIFDNTNLKQKYIDDILYLKTPKTLVKYQVFGENLTIDELYQRAQGRDFCKVEKEVIQQQYMLFRQLLPQLPAIFSQFETKWQKITQNPELKQCIVFDIDGTLALNKSGRSYYDMTRVDEDDVNVPVADTCRIFYQSGFHIIICSGRSDDSLPKTVWWLRHHNIPFNDIYMRKLHDNRKDFVVKEEIWREIAEKYYIMCMYDDRESVVYHARKLGLTVFQVEKNNS
jgi:RNA ligase